jgi:hypothetical protein
MKFSPHVIITGSICFIALSCRDVQPVLISEQINGYYLRGVVTTASGIPLDSVTVILYYNYSYIGSTPLDTIPVTVPDAATYVNVAVYTMKNIFVRTLFSGTMPHAGIISSFPWDGLDDERNPVPSGLYQIRYVVGSTIVKNAPYIIDGHPTARTDSTGYFTLTDENLPIGQRFDANSSSIPAVGVYQVTPQITVQFFKNNLTSSYTSLWLARDEVTYHAFTF